MTNKDIFVYKLFLPLNISDFTLFFMEKLQPSLKMLPPLSQETPSKNRDLVNLPLPFF